MRGQHAAGSSCRRSLFLVPLEGKHLITVHLLSWGGGQPVGWAQVRPVSGGFTSLWNPLPEGLGCTW